MTYTYGTTTVPCGNYSIGQLCSASSSVSTTNFTSYDALGRVLAGNQVTAGQTYSFSYTYNHAGGLLTETYPSGRIITTAYDAAGRFSSLTGQKSGEPNKTYTSSYSFAAHGGVSSMQLGNSLWEHTNFNTRLQPTQIGLGTSSNDSSKLRLDYGYGTSNNGNMMSQSIVIGGTTYAQSYTYDALNRLGTATEGSNWSQTYTYDQYGNRAVTAGYIPLPALTPQSLSAFSSSTNQLTNSSYDNVGNLTTDATSRTFTYDAENRQVSYNGGLGIVTYSYDGDGRRVQKLESGVTTVYVYDAQGRLAADYKSDSATGAGGTSYLTADHLGSMRVITDSGGNVKARRDYLPFGEEIASSIGGRSGITGYGTVDNIRQRFTGQYRDTESGLDYFIARYHSGPQGRLQSPDPENDGGRIIDPQSWNGYAYGLNSPDCYVDSEGYVANLPPAVVGAVIGASWSWGGYAVGRWFEGQPLTLAGSGAALASGAITGGLAGATFGGSLFAKLVTSGPFANVVGNAVGRAIDPNDKLWDPEALANDVAFGFLGSVLGNRAKAILTQGEIRELDEALKKISRGGKMRPNRKARIDQIKGKIRAWEERGDMFSIYFGSVGSNWMQPIFQASSRAQANRGFTSDFNSLRWVEILLRPSPEPYRELREEVEVRLKY